MNGPVVEMLDAPAPKGWGKVGCTDTACPCESPFWDEERRACDSCGRVTETTRVRINQKGGPSLCSSCF